MKKLIIMLVVLISIVTVSPKLIGSLAVDERQSIITQLNKAEDITVTSKSYSAHWFGAESVSEVTLQLTQEGLGEVTILVDEVLSFGPVIITGKDWYLALAHSEINLRSSGEVVNDEVMNFIKDKVHLSATYTLANNIVTYIKTDEVSFEDGDTQFIAQPSDGQFSLINKKDFNGTLNWGGLELKGTNGSFVIDTIAMDTQQSLVTGSYLEGTAILSGDTRFVVDSINVSDMTASEQFSLAKLLFTTNVAVKDDLLALSMAYSAENIVSAGQTFKQPNLDVVFSDIDINALQELNTLLASLPVNVAEQGISAEASKEMAKLADKFLVKDPSLKITDLSLITEQGKIASDLVLQIDKESFDSENLMSIMSALIADAKGNAPAEFFTQFGVTPMIDSFVEQGYLTKKDSELSFVAKYTQGQLKINGKAIPY